ncbi:MAG TPA: glycosyltransferase family 2 protein [Candidatus Polarisedimenticolia bacterium]
MIDRAGPSGPGQRPAGGTNLPAPVSIVIVTWNSARYIADCLRSLRDLRRPPAETVVLDNASTDGTPEIVRGGFPEVVFIPNGANLGFCRANNLGIARTASPFVLVLNPDTRLGGEFLEELLPVFEDARVGMASGKLLRFDGKTIDSAGQELSRSRQPKDRGYGRRDTGQFDRDQEVFGVCGAAALYRRTMLVDLAARDGSFFDESFFAFYEDLDIAWRARRRGWKAAYRHRAIGLHARGGTARGPRLLRRLAALLGRDPEIRFHIAKNRYMTILRNDTPRGYVSNLPFILARDLGMAALLLLSSPGVLRRLWRERAFFRRALELRRSDAVRPVPVRD